MRILNKSCICFSIQHDYLNCMLINQTGKIQSTPGNLRGNTKFEIHQIRSDDSKRLIIR